MALNFDLNTFREKFARNFPFIPYYDSEKTYKKDDIVYDTEGEAYYKSLKDDNTAELDMADSWGTPTSDEIAEYVTDKDILFAKDEADGVANEAFVTDLAYLYLIAFFLCYDLDLASAGASGTTSFPAKRKRVGSVDEEYAIPKWIEDDPIFSFYARNGFGLKYLTLIRPYLVGNVEVVMGWTSPA